MDMVERLGEKALSMGGLCRSVAIDTTRSAIKYVRRRGLRRIGRDAAQGRIVGQIGDLVGVQGALAIQKMLEVAREPAKGIFATVAGLVTLIFGASLVVSELKSSLNLIWRAPVPAESKGVLRGI